MSDTQNSVFYRDKFGVAQRRRVEALILVHRLWPVLEPRIAVEIATWLIRGNPSARIPTVVSEHAAEMEKLWKVYDQAAVKS